MTVDDPRGSVWRRWDPHIHTPGTAENDQFGPDAWDAYLTAIEKSEPRIEALGITDYASLDNYETVLKYQSDGRLPDVGLIFPNIELRFAIGTKAAAPVNFHLLIPSDKPDYLEEARRFLRSLTFKVGGETYRCEPEDLRKLGRKHKGDQLDDDAAQKAGIRQFKVSLDVLREAFNGSEWATANIIVAVAAGTNDGSSGVRDDDAGLESLRREIDRMARVMFTSSPAQRLYWSGEGTASREDLEATSDGLKVCLHGSDAHAVAEVGKPNDDRFTWLKGDLTFETLRQAILEPRDRAIVDDRPPQGALPYRVIDQVTVSDAAWLATPDLPLNSGLVAIIGARGSGKTALADLIAAGGLSLDPSEESFLSRAAKYIGNESVKLTWGDSEVSASSLALSALDASESYVQYLSQQFVERLCSSEGLAAELLAEIERVIFEEHPGDQRLGASGFGELLDRLAARGRSMRARADEGIEETVAEIDAERAIKQGLDALKNERTQVAKLLETDRQARKGILVEDGQGRAARLEEITVALEAKQAELDALRQREGSLTQLSDAVTDYTDRKFPAVPVSLQKAHPNSGLNATDWQAFAVNFEGDPQTIIATGLTSVRGLIKKLTGIPATRPDEVSEGVAAFVADDADLGKATLSELTDEAWRLKALAGLDAAKLQKLKVLGDKITTAERRQTELDIQIANATGADARIKSLTASRNAFYAQIFDGFAEEQAQLANLYAPLAELLAAEDGALANLTFSVERKVDVEAWASLGETLIDTRREGDFRGRGELLRVAREELLSAWREGSGQDVAEAMATFRDKHGPSLLSQANMARDDATAYRRWVAAVSAWLNNTDHISLQYGIQYDGVDIRQLSPGTRGIVLLLLYLAVDRSDDRPLLIDQPEENLDPKSIFTELVGRFRSARSRRQIIIVTHNANLVVNTDADQVIVAKAGPHQAHALPLITYTSGGLENPDIRAEVCDILEGGEQAFKDRARRLRLRIA